VTTYLHRCGDCGAAFETSRPASGAHSCRTPGCSGRPERVLGVVLYRSRRESVVDDADV
jgi:hypothetical protein